MDIREYIESGILEQYVLGKVTEKERLEVEQYAQEYPEIKAEIEAIEIALEEYAFLHKVPPSPEGLDKIMARIEPPSPPKTSSIPSIGAIIALLLLAATALLLFNRNRGLQKSINEYELRVNNLTADRDLCNTNLRQLRIKLNIIRAEGNIPVVMKGNEALQDAVATVHWNPSSSESYLDIINLPPPAADKQYQLWAIIDGQPTDMGPLDKELVADNFIEVPHLGNVQAFAVSEEPLGGSPSPTKVIMVGSI